MNAAASAWPAAWFPDPDERLPIACTGSARTLILWGREDALIAPAYGDALQKGDIEREAAAHCRGRARAGAGEAAGRARGDP
ncbi:MAG: hypothetical protein U1E23_03305 [Reyranellaceae bacterium]